MLQAENLTIELKSEKDEFFILRDFSIHLNKGEILGLAGESGSGKSVFAKSVLGLNTAPIYTTGGNILVENQIIENNADYKA
ncbi:MAG: ATP-binding cassette domain-containing protein, partial [Mucispirillum sp.]|nr:ATP-binding cassette domain-containing protein [Mucispirillum sp.]